MDNKFNKNCICDEYAINVFVCESYVYWTVHHCDS